MDKRMSTEVRTAVENWVTHYVMFGLEEDARAAFDLVFADGVAYATQERVLDLTHEAAATALRNRLAEHTERHEA